CQSIAAVASDETGPCRCAAVQLLVSQQHLHLRRGEAVELECARRATKSHQFRRSFPAGQDQAAVVCGFSEDLQQSSVAVPLGTVPASALTWLEQCLRIVENEQATPASKHLQKRRNPL